MYLEEETSKKKKTRYFLLCLLCMSKIFLWVKRVKDDFQDCNKIT